MIKYIRYQTASIPRYGILDGETVHDLPGPFGESPIGETHQLADLTLLPPCVPAKILAVGLNYRSHLGSRPAPANPEIFYKPVSCLQSPGGPIVIPPGAANVHYEGELVLVIGRRTRHASLEEAARSIFGVTCGNDVSDRDWQNGAAKDLQWWRAKGADTFGPLGPAIVTGLDFSDLLLTTRLNGETVQQQRTSDLLFPAPAIVSYISRWVTLEPGDIIYSGTPGSTRKMNPGDLVEVEIEGVGILRNPVVAA
ncbi:MAG TPA: fumarylacetoacetate hydrolase family protein [Bryobacteraceae bacterium]|nr:fumarylacetoacetate hydrolase family protein [Bryobacteraceae bacterium]